MTRRTPWIAINWLLFCSLAVAQEMPLQTGWHTSFPTSGSHRGGVDLSGPHGGKGAGKLTSIVSGQEMPKDGRACFTQEFVGKQALKPGRTYRYSVCYRTDATMDGSGQVLIDSYTKEGEKSHKALVSKTLKPSAAWQTVAGEVAVPGDAVRVRMLLYLRGPGTIWYDDAFFGDAAPDAPNRLTNGGFEPPASCVFDLAPEKRSGNTRFVADFENATLGKVKQLGPDEYYLFAFPEDKPHSPFLWFHFRVEGCQGREITFHVNPAPFSQAKTAGNGTRLPVMSYDGEHWTGIDDKSWNEDGTVLTFKQRFTQAQVWIASFFPFTAEHITRFIEQNKASPWFRSGVVGRTKQGRDIRMYTITDPSVPESEKRVILFITLQHNLETTGALALEGLCRFVLSDDPCAARLRRQFVFYVVPQMDPDGIAQGNMYCPVGNLNRQWGLGTTAETTCIEKFVRELGERGHKVDLFMDFHGWCHTTRTTLFLTFGHEICDQASEDGVVRLADTIKPRLTGEVKTSLRRQRVTTVTGITGDLNRLSCGWLKFEAGARLCYSIEIFGEGECTQQGYWDWGRAFGEGIADFYGLGEKSAP